MPFEKELLDYVRSLSKADYKNLSQRALKTAEEVGELASVVLPYDNAFGTTHRFADKHKILVELADSLLCLLSIQHDLDISDEQMTAVMWEKARYWHSLQVRAGRGIDNIPFEIHITIEEPDRLAPRMALEEACKSLNVKPLILEMETSNGTKYDYQSSSTHRGTNRTAYEEMKRISNGLTSQGFKVIREKIETVPWHPAAPRMLDGSASHVMPPNCYFETHFVVLVPEDKLGSLYWLEQNTGAVGGTFVIRLSRNMRKPVENGLVKVIVTTRSPDLVLETYQKLTEQTREQIEAYKINATIEEAMTEFSVYDTAISHDDAWIKGV